MTESRVAVSAVFKADAEQRFTYGVAYPALRKDGHGEFASREQVEKTAWDWMERSRTIGLFHADGLVGHGTVVESTIWRGPDWSVVDGMGNEQVVKSGDWLVGVIWSEAAWPHVLAGNIDGFSIQGSALRRATARQLPDTAV